jgi:signal transduction histidine kinase
MEQAKRQKRRFTLVFKDSVPTKAAIDKLRFQQILRILVDNAATHAKKDLISVVIGYK